MHLVACWWYYAIIWISYVVTETHLKVEGLWPGFRNTWNFMVPAARRMVNLPGCLQSFTQKCVYLGSDTPLMPPQLHKWSLFWKTNKYNNHVKYVFCQNISDIRLKQSKKCENYLNKSFLLIFCASLFVICSDSKRFVITTATPFLKSLKLFYDGWHLWSGVIY